VTEFKRDKKTEEDDAKGTTEESESGGKRRAAPGAAVPKGQLGFAPPEVSGHSILASPRAQSPAQPDRYILRARESRSGSAVNQLFLKDLQNIVCNLMFYCFILHVATSKMFRKCF